MPSEADYRLPRTVIPSHYELTLTPDLAAASFSGHVVVDVAVVEPVSEIVLNTAELTLHDVTLFNEDGQRFAGNRRGRRRGRAVDTPPRRDRGGGCVEARDLLRRDPERRPPGLLSLRLHRSERCGEDDRHHPIRGDRSTPGLPLLGRARPEGDLRRHAHRRRRPDGDLERRRSRADRRSAAGRSPSASSTP